MREIQDEQLLSRYLEQYKIPSLFDTPDLPFRLYEYEPGEMMNILRDDREYLKFVVEGVVELYTILDDGTPYLIHHCEGFGFLGDLAFCGRAQPGRYQEVVQMVRAIELPITPLRETLNKDLRFLHYLLDTMAYRMTLSMRVQTDRNSAEEALLTYLRWQCPDHAITNVGETAFHLNYSRRQLQRVLKDMTQKGTLKKISKGHYILSAQNHRR